MFMERMVMEDKQSSTNNNTMDQQHSFNDSAQEIHPTLSRPLSTVSSDHPHHSQQQRQQQAPPPPPPLTPQHQQSYKQQQQQQAQPQPQHPSVFAPVYEPYYYGSGGGGQPAYSPQNFGDSLPYYFSTPPPSYPMATAMMMSMMDQNPSAMVPQGWILFRLKTQVEFYFSFENLCRDEYLVRQLLSYGGHAVPCHVVGSFPRVRNILGGSCASPALLQQALQYSNIVRVLNDMLVPLTDALEQAMQVRRQGPQAVYEASCSASGGAGAGAGAGTFLPMFDIYAAARYSPQTTTTEDTTTANSSVATVPPPTPPVLTPVYSTDPFVPLPHELTSPMPTENTEEKNWQQDDDYPQQQQTLSFPDHLHQEDEDEHLQQHHHQKDHCDVIQQEQQQQQVPYGYTVTAPTVLPDSVGYQPFVLQRQQQQQPHTAPSRKKYNRKKNKSYPLEQHAQNPLDGLQKEGDVASTGSANVDMNNDQHQKQSHSEDNRKQQYKQYRGSRRKSRKFNSNIINGAVPPEAVSHGPLQPVPKPQNQQPQTGAQQQHKTQTGSDQSKSTQQQEHQQQQQANKSIHQKKYYQKSYGKWVNKDGTKLTTNHNGAIDKCSTEQAAPAAMKSLFFKDGDR